MTLLTAVYIHAGVASTSSSGTPTNSEIARAPPPAVEPKSVTPSIQPTQGNDNSIPRADSQHIVSNDDAAVLKHISLLSSDESSSQLILTLSKPVSHYIFMLAEPDRIVIDLDNTSGDISTNTQLLTNDLIQMVRSGSHEDGRLRIVLDLRVPAYAGSQLQGPDKNGEYKLVINVHPIPITQEKPQQPTSPPTPVRSSRRPAVVAPDMIELDLNYENAPMGTIDAIEYAEGYMLPLTQLFQILGFPIQVYPDRGLAEGWLIHRNRLFVLDTTRGISIVDGKQGKFRKGLSQIRDQDIYMDISLLNQLLPVRLQLDPSTLKLSLKVDPDLPEDQRRAVIEQWLSLNGKSEVPAVPLPAKPQPPLITQGAPAPEIETLAQKEMSVGKPKKDVVAESGMEVSEDDLVILQPVIDRIPVNDFIQSYHIGHTYLLPLQALADILEFPISVDIDAGKASGWFISEDRTFSMDLVSRQAKIGGISKPLPRDKVYKTDTDIYIDSNLISQWFPLDFEFDLSKLLLKISPREMLPFQIREKRLEDWDKLQNRRRGEENFDIINTPYQLASLPFLDFNISQNYTNQGEDKFKTDYSLLASGDFGYLNSNLFAAGSSIGRTVDTVRLSGGRKSDTDNLLGGLRASSYAVGDINSITIPLVGQSSLGRGFTASNRPLFLANAFDSTNFIGDLQPDWEVELYRNGALIGFQVVGANGRYEFLNVPILYGNNTFQLIFHGPQGQQAEEIRRFNIDSTFLREGDMNYEFSVDEKSTPLIDVGENNDVNYQHKLRAGSEFEYGLNNTLTGTIGFMATPLTDNEEHHYLTAGLRKSFSSFLGSLDAAYDGMNGGRAARLAIIGDIWNINIKGKYSKFNKFISEEIVDSTNLLDNMAELNLNSMASFHSFDNININLNMKREHFATGENRTIISNTLAKSLLGFRLTNYLENVSSQSLETTRGELSLRSHLLGALVRADLMYSIRPEIKSDRFKLSLQKKLRRDLTAQLDLSKYMGNGNVNTVSGSLNWEEGNYTLSLYSSYDSENKQVVRANLNISFGKTPNSGQWLISGKDMSTGGILSARAYLDKNLNNEFDKGEEIIDDARFKINQSDLSAKDGIAVAVSLPADHYATIRIDPAGLEDPLWLPAVKGYRFLPRPGVVTTVDFPVVETSEIDGIVNLVDRDGNKRPMSRVGVELIDISDNSVIKEVRSEFDGFYIFEKILPGKYKIRVRDKDLQRLNLSQEKEITLDVASSSDTYSNLDISLHKTNEPIEISHRD